MVSILKKIYKSNLVISALNLLSKYDYVARAIFSYWKQSEDVLNLIKKMDLSNYNEINDEIEKLKVSTNYLSSLFKDALKEDYDKVVNKSDFNELTSLYIVNNFFKLCPSPSLLSYYERISFLEKKLENNFPLMIRLAIMLRAGLIVEKLSKLNNDKLIDNFVSMLENSNDREHQILYVIYYGLFDNDGSKYNYLKEVDDEKVAWKLLNNKDRLPDSIIIHVFSDKQFEGNTYGILFILFVVFMCSRGNEEVSKLDIIQKLFNNNIKDFNSEAEFLNLTPLITKAYESFKSNSSTFYDDVLDVMNGTVILDRMEDDNSYGSI